MQELRQQRHEIEGWCNHCSGCKQQPQPRRPRRNGQRLPQGRRSSRAFRRGGSRQNLLGIQLAGHADPEEKKQPCGRAQASIGHQELAPVA
eukprot:Skav230368  [mRNA]  locus=scaffold4112:9280:11803:- [translate_table: standard]